MSKTNGKPKNDGKKTDTESKRANIHAVISVILAKHGGTATPEQIETEGQKIKKQTKGRYAKVASTEYEVKDGKVVSKPSVKGLEIAVRFASKTGHHPIVSKYPKEAAEVAQRLKLKLPAPKSGEKKDSPPSSV